MTVVSVGERHCDGGRNPTVHAGGSAIETVNPPTARPLGLLRDPYELSEATYGGSSTNSCSNEG